VLIQDIKTISHCDDSPLRSKSIAYLTGSGFCSIKTRGVELWRRYFQVANALLLSRRCIELSFGYERTVVEFWYFERTVIIQKIGKWKAIGKVVEFCVLQGGI